MSLWEKHDSVEDYQKALELRLIERAQKDVDNGDIKKAINRYEGFFEYYPLNQVLHNKVALLYIQINGKKRAGRHLYLKENPSDDEKECIAEFEKAYGNSPTIILKKLIYKEHFRIKELDMYRKHRLKKLIEEACIETGFTPSFLKGIKIYLEKDKSL